MDTAHDEPASTPSVNYYTSLAPDGDVILALSSARNPQDKVLYRVDKLILSRHSPTFSGLFSIPYDSAANEEYDGVPVVHLDDHAEDIFALLQWLYDPS